MEQKLKAQSAELKVFSFALYAFPPLSLRWTRLVVVAGSFALPLYGAGVVTSSLNAAKVYPNPWRLDTHINTSITFDNLPAASTVKLFTVSGHEVRTLVADSSGLATWDRANDAGDKVASGLYLYLIADPAGNEATGKLAIIR